MWRNIGGVLINMERLCYVNFEEEDEQATATLHFTDYSETLTFEGKSVDKLRSVFERLLGTKNNE
jgi:hypothetical protein